MSEIVASLLILLVTAIIIMLAYKYKVKPKLVEAIINAIADGKITKEEVQSILDIIKDTYVKPKP